MKSFAFFVVSFYVAVLSLCEAKDYGVQGHTFEIIEPDLLKQITGRLVSLDESGQLDQHNQVIQKRVEKSVRNPKAVEGLTRALETKSFAYDPSITVPYDLKDHKGVVFHKAGTVVNPLTFKSMTHSLVFLAGDDPDQVEWALKNFDLDKVRLVLTSGSPFDLMERLDRPVFFDQHGSLTRKFTIKHLPATVEQTGRLLLVTEVAL
jgi:conjugal transfer pilus assembly protein TraW